MTNHSNYEIDVERLAALLHPLAEIEPVLRRNGRRVHVLRPLAIAATLALLIAVSVAAAASLGPFDHIASVNHPATPSDSIPQAVIAQLRADQPPAGLPDAIGTRLVDQGRLLGAIPGGSRVYAVPTSKGKLCVVIALSSETCAAPRSRENPITFTIETPGNGAPTIVWGVTVDGVDSVSFEVAGKPVSVPVHGNFYAWVDQQGNPPSQFSAANVRFNDGTTVVAR